MRKEFELDNTKVVWKLFRQLKNGEITSLFINKKRRLPYNEWLEAEEHPTDGYKFRPFWHCTEKPNAPHLSEKDRIWLKVEISDYEEFDRPEYQGGKWYLAKNMRILN
jgi:hypothetical protein